MAQHSNKITLKRLPLSKDNSRTKDFAVKQQILTHGFSTTPRREPTNTRSSNQAQTPKAQQSKDASQRNNAQRLQTELAALVRPESAPAGCAVAKLRRGMARKAQSSCALGGNDVFAERDVCGGGRSGHSYDPMALFVACSKGRHKEVLKICQKFHTKSAIEAKGLNGFTPLHYACSTGASLAARILLSYDRSLLLTKDESGCTALHVAARRSNSGVIQFLLTSCSSTRQRQQLVDAVDNDGRTALIEGCDRNDMNIVYALRNFGGADCNILDSIGDTALDYVRDPLVATLFSSEPCRVKLPLDSFLHIFSYLDPASRRAAQCVSKEWQWMVLRYSFPRTQRP